jgi:hypothetical protein
MGISRELGVVVDQDRISEHPQDESVSYLIRHNVNPDRVPEFEAWLNGIESDMRPYRGYQGTTFLRPAAGSSEYVIVVRFASYQDLRRWEGSPERADWLAKLPPMLSGKSEYKTESGLESWFQLPGHQVVVPPPRYKMALLITLAIYPLLLIVIPGLGFLLGDIPYLAVPVTLSAEFFTRTLMNVAVLVPLMTWLAMPQLTRLFRRWLHPTG